MGGWVDVNDGGEPGSNKRAGCKLLMLGWGFRSVSPASCPGAVNQLGVVAEGRREARTGRLF